MSRWLEREIGGLSVTLIWEALSVDCPIQQGAERLPTDGYS